MTSENIYPLYKRLLILGLLLSCLGVFGSHTLTETAYARVCIEVCYDRQNSCYDNCPSDCSLTDQTCHDCLALCDSRFDACVSGSQFCNTGYSYTPRCQVDWTYHCVLINDQCAPNDDRNHWGYTETCNYGPGGSQCVACPDHEICTGSNGLPPCP